MSQLPNRLPIELPEEVRPILRAESMTLGVVLGGGAKVDLRASYPDEPAAVIAEKTLRTAAESGRKKLAKLKAEMEESVRGKAEAKKPRPIADLPARIDNHLVWTTARHRSARLDLRSQVKTIDVYRAWSVDRAVRSVRREAR